MADRPIIFSAPMVRALLDGRKTQTRRLLNPQPPEWATFFQLPDMLNALGQWVPSGLWRWSEPENNSGEPLRCWPIDKEGDHFWLRPRFATGDRLYVREAWSHSGDGVWSINDARMSAYTNGRPIYRATDAVDAGTKVWPSIHMPREFSRLTLIVQSVKVERLQDISEADAIAEGAAKLSWDGEGHWFEDEHGGTHRCGFAGLWTHLHGATSWEDNPFVVALTFRVVHGNIDALACEQVPA